MSMATNVSIVDDEAAVKAEALACYNEKCSKHIQDTVLWQQFWRDALNEGIFVPYDGATSVWNRHVNLAQYGEYDYETSTSALDEQATIREFAKVAQWAKRLGYTVEKKYSDDEFSIKVSGIPEPVRSINFYSTRQVVCKRVEVGTKLVEAHTEPVYEYQCDKIAFLNVKL